MKMRTYCLACIKCTNNVDSKKGKMINAAIRNKSKCAFRSNKKSRFMELNHNKKSGQ